MSSFFRGKSSRRGREEDGARSRSVCDLTQSAVAAGQKIGSREEPNNDDTLNCSENFSDEENDGQESLHEHSKPSSNIHIPNVRKDLKRCYRLNFVLTTAI